ncbi:MAG: hypothetical protein H6736_14990 [Alphaproteobacteria bacterium]|nr:hypothetical protein [Alphaproteobacteria bacterium]MCB9693114.1 hypothetical protein [Alphaproteobacteria bacterium]
MGTQEPIDAPVELSAEALAGVWALDPAEGVDFDPMPDLTVGDSQWLSGWWQYVPPPPSPAAHPFCQNDEPGRPRRTAATSGSWGELTVDAVYTVWVEEEDLVGWSVRLEVPDGDLGAFGDAVIATLADRLGDDPQLRKAEVSMGGVVGETEGAYSATIWASGSQAYHATSFSGTMHRR